MNVKNVNTIEKAFKLKNIYWKKLCKASGMFHSDDAETEKKERWMNLKKHYFEKHYGVCLFIGQVTGIKLDDNYSKGDVFYL